MWHSCHLGQQYWQREPSEIWSVKYQTCFQDLYDFQRHVLLVIFIFKIFFMQQHNFSYFINWGIGSFMSSVPGVLHFLVPFFGFSYAWHLAIFHLFLLALYYFALAFFFNYIWSPEWTSVQRLKGHVLWNRMTVRITLPFWVVKMKKCIGGRTRESQEGWKGASCKSLQAGFLMRDQNCMISMDVHLVQKKKEIMSVLF